MTDKRFFWITFATSVLLALFGWMAPQRRIPLDYDAMIYRSILFAVTWAAVGVAALWRCKARGLWMLLGGPVALYWPVWLIFNHFPQCYDLSNCE